MLVLNQCCSGSPLKILFQQHPPKADIAPRCGSLAGYLYERETGRCVMTHDEFMKKLLANPRFKPAKKTGRAYVMPGAKPAASEPDKLELLPTGEKQ